MGRNYPEFPGPEEFRFPADEMESCGISDGSNFLLDGRQKPDSLNFKNLISF
jgi:hypothetical protein